MKRSRDSSSDEEEEDEEPEEYGNSDIEDEEDGEGQSDYDDDDNSDEDAENSGKEGEMPTIDPNVPMYKLLQQAKAAHQLQKQAASTDDSSLHNSRTKRIKHEKRKSRDEKVKRVKSAPAEMRSDKPVRRLRIDADNSTKKFVDPR